MTKLTYALLLACLLFAGGCFQPDPYSGSRNPLVARSNRKKAESFRRTGSMKETSNEDQISLPRWGE